MSRMCGHWSKGRKESWGVVHREIGSVQDAAFLQRWTETRNRPKGLTRYKIWMSTTRHVRYTWLGFVSPIGANQSVPPNRRILQGFHCFLDNSLFTCTIHVTQSGRTISRIPTKIRMRRWCLKRLRIWPRRMIISM